MQQRGDIDVERPPRPHTWDGTAAATLPEVIGAQAGGFDGFVDFLEWHIAAGLCVNIRLHFRPPLQAA